VSAFVINSYAFGGEDPDAKAYLDAVETADTQALEAAVRKVVDDFVKGLKADGIWSVIKAACILAGARTLTGALTPLVGSAPTNISGNFVSGDYNRETGLVGNASNKVINTNIQDTAISPVGAIGCYVTTPDTRTNWSLMGSQGTGGGASTNEYTLQRFTTDRSAFGGNVPNASSASIVLSGPHTSSRQSNSQFDRVTGSSLAHEETSSVSPTTRGQSCYVFARNGSSPNYTNARIAAYWLFEGSHTRSNIISFHARVTTLITDLDAAI
jgi:hypothetical protein